jgi:uncharacterized delta-60 repeat protein
MLSVCATAQGHATPVYRAPAARLSWHTFVASRAGTITAIGFARPPAELERRAPEGRGVALVRYLGSGRVDTSFRRRVHPEFGEGALAATVDPKDRILVAACRPPGCWGYAVLARFLPDGRLDARFGDHGIVRTEVTGRALAPRAIERVRDGRIVVAGEVSKGSVRFAFIARYLADGLPDRTFGGDGIVIDERFLGAQALAVQPDGRVLIAGPAFVARYRTDGTRDPTFDDDGLAGAPGFLTVGDVLQDLRGRIVVGGSAGRRERPSFAVARLTVTGKRDPSFGRRGVVHDLRQRDHWAQVERLVPLPDGRLIAVGWATRGKASPLTRGYRAVVLRFTAGGRLAQRTTVEEVESLARAAFVQRGQLVLVGANDDRAPTHVAFARVPYR